MHCPFLREAQVKYCQGSSIKKLIVRTPSETIQEQCSSRDYVNCSVFKQKNKDHSLQKHCPFLQESLAQYCAASPVTKYVPYSESSITRCGNDGYRYCESFLSMASPKEQSFASQASLENMVDGILVPEHLTYSHNHMWMDQTEGGMCHIGVDAFLTKIFSQVDAINFLSPSCTTLPAIVLTINGVDLQLMFPFPVLVTGTNTYLRANVQKLISHPYSSGWLFEGMITEQSGLEPSSISAAPMMRGKEAVEWMQQEVCHLAEFVHNQVKLVDASKHLVMADGGGVYPGFIQHLNSSEITLLFNEFFSRKGNWRKRLC